MLHGMSHNRPTELCHSDVISVSHFRLCTFITESLVYKHLTSLTDVRCCEIMKKCFSEHIVAQEGNFLYVH